MFFSGAHHIVDSNEISFILAAKGAMGHVKEFGKWQLLEPIMKVEVSCPTEFQGKIMTTLNKRQGVVINIDTVDQYFVVNAEVSPSVMQFFLSFVINSNGEFFYFRYPLTKCSAMHLSLDLLPREKASSQWSTAGTHQ